MIKYLHKQRAKKGFTMVELIIVIAIIGILTALVMPLFNNDQAERRAANTYASDFYSSLQYCLTRYQKTDYHINTAMENEYNAYKADPATTRLFIYYDSGLAQNVLMMPAGKTSYNLYMELYYEDGIKHIKLGASLEELMVDTSVAPDNACEKLLQQDLDDLINGAGNGYYYAVVNFDKDAFNNFKVLSAHYCDEKLPSYSASAAVAFKDGLMFVDESELKCGVICGTCSTDQNFSGNYVGNLGTYMLNVDDVQENELTVYLP